MTDAPAADSDRVCHYCTFRLAGHLFGFDLRLVKEVNTQTCFTPIPQAPPEVRGYVNLRGHLFLVLDLRLLLGLESAPLTADSRLLIFKPTAGESFGVLVDQIGDIATLGADLTEAVRPDEPSPVEEAAAARRAGELIAGIGKLEGELLVIVDPTKLLPAVAEIMREQPTKPGERGT
jgi:purine-binding chemotaxis protein CheW